jgi:hypothetical protein
MDQVVLPQQLLRMMTVILEMICLVTQIVKKMRRPKREWLNTQLKKPKVGDPRNITMQSSGPFSLCKGPLLNAPSQYDEGIFVYVKGLINAPSQFDEGFHFFQIAGSFITERNSLIGKIFFDSAATKKFFKKIKVNLAVLHLIPFNILSFLQLDEIRAV